jgi:hypothetical protein
MAAFRADAERKRGVELEEMRAQVSRMRESAAEHARSAAAAAVAAEVRRAKSVAVATPRRMPTEVYGVPHHTPARPTPAVLRYALPVAASLLILGTGAYVFGLGPAVRSIVSASLGLVSGDEREPAAEPTPPPKVDTPRKQPTPTRRQSAATGTGRLQVASDPTGAQVLLDGREVGVAPLDLDDVPAGTHTLELRSSAGTVKRTITVRAGQRTVAEESIGPGYVAVVSKVPLDLFAGNRRIGTTEDDRILLPPGTHTLTMVSTRFRFRGELQIEIKPGQVTAYTASLPSGKVIINTAPGAEILIEGERVGVAPLDSLDVPIGTRDIVVRHATLGEKRLSLEVRRNQTEVITVTLNNPSFTDRPSPPRPAPLSAPPAPRPRE